MVEGREITAYDITVHGEDVRTFGEYKDVPESQRKKLLDDLKDYEAHSKAQNTNKVSADYKKRLNQEFTEPEINPASVIPFDTAKLQRHGPEVDFIEAKYYLARNGISATTEITNILKNLFGDRDKIREFELVPLVNREKAKQA